jgi:hypothetical protein
VAAKPEVFVAFFVRGAEIPAGHFGFSGMWLPASGVVQSRQGF